ncbi:MAG TPA: adenylate/guanylate cyclase domain-containing protein [Candidatus Polarisedimenticolia bacterium]|nr:adenylate/guanylate cyclase domain-containing protein [Candidatus Polarisedimenticolia bacterium]
MKFKPVKLAPALIALGVITLCCVLSILRLDLFERFEKITYDWRVREALRFPAPAATNLAFVYIDDASIAYVKTNHLPHPQENIAELGYRYGLYWPRQVYGRLVEELATEKAKSVGLDVIFADRRPDLGFVEMADGTRLESDDFFGLEMRRASNVVLAATSDVIPPPSFSTNAMALGHINTDKITDKDADGILRRAKAFDTHRKWHFAFQKVEDDPEYGVDLSKGRIESNHVILPRSNGDDIVVPLDSDGNFDPASLWSNLPKSLAAKAKPFTQERIWHMGIVLAAHQLNLDLGNADVDLAAGRITLRGTNGLERIIPVDRNGYFYIDWRLKPNDPRLTQAPIENLLLQDAKRLRGETNNLKNRFAGKLVVVGSVATGNDLRDEGATPLEPDTFLVSEHWNVANSVITGRFIQRSSVAVDCLIIIIAGLATALLIWNLPIRLGTSLALVLAAGYIATATLVYIYLRYWLPLVLPLMGGFLVMYALLVAWRVLFEQAEQRRVKSVFSRMVSTNVMHEVLQAETLSLGGARRQVTILFADVRGFTEFTDKSQDQAAAYIAQNKLSQEQADVYYDEQARETLNTVNTYLALVADQVKKHDGTLDKYIGDCVMAFWGAPTTQDNQALCCVRAAIDAQRAVFDLNKQRVQENQKRELENMQRASCALAPRPMLPILLLGSGINTGLATAGLMGSEQDRFNYTVFGREVNLASRLESLSGRGRILIGETTYKCLQRDDPALAATCTALPELQKLKGFGAAVKVYEVPWRLPGSDPFDEEFASRIFGDTASTNFLKKENL